MYIIDSCVFIYKTYSIYRFTILVGIVSDKSSQIKYEGCLEIDRHIFYYSIMYSWLNGQAFNLALSFKTLS